MHSDHRLSNKLSRRGFLRSTASLAALAQLRPAAAALIKQNAFAYAACGKIQEEEGTIQVFSLHRREWTPIQRVPTRAPACLVLSPNQQTLYVANKVDTHKGLPYGTVEAFSIDPSYGYLRLLSQQALSLAATHPRQMALSPNGKLLAVAADGGAIYNLLPVLADGSLDRPCGIFKQLGGVADTRPRAEAHPYNLLFDTTGNHLLSSGFGSDRLSTFAVAHDPTSRRMQRRAAEVNDPSAYQLHPDGSILYVWHKIENNLSCYRYDSVSGRVGEAIQRISMPGDGRDAIKALAIHPSGRMLYTAETAQSYLQAWQIRARDGLLSPARHIEFDDAPGDEIIVPSNGESLFVLDRLRGLIHRIAIDSATGELGFVEDVAQIQGAQSVVFKTL
jgi:6-phosphogluconolactonase (cycloisomerase 2 family)